MRVRLLVASGVALALLAALALSEDTRTVALLLGRGSSVARDPGQGARRLVLDTSPELVADFYPAAQRDGRERPLLVLVHGSDAQGRRNVVVRLLAERLSGDGFPVLAMDLRGFGESEDPPAPLAEHLRFAHDVAAAAAHAVSAGLTKHGRVVYVGHSLGAAVVLGAARLEPHPAAVVALGTPPLRDRLRGEGRAFARRRLQDMGQPVSESSILAMERSLLDLDPAAPEAGGVPVPSLLVFGEHEVEGRALPRWGEPHGILVVPDADHRYGIEEGPWGLSFYDRRTMRAVTAAIGDWAESWGS